MRPEIDYVYNKLKRLRFDFNSIDFKDFRSEYRYEPTLDRYVRKDDNDLFIAKDTFKPLEDELEYADNCHNLEEQLGCPLEVREKALIKDFIWYDDNGRLIQVIPMNSGYIMEKGKKIAVLNCIYNFNFWLAIKCKDYKKTWWLKEDKE